MYQLNRVSDIQKSCYGNFGLWINLQGITVRYLLETQPLTIGQLQFECHPWLFYIWAYIHDLSKSIIFAVYIYQSIGSFFRFVAIGSFGHKIQQIPYLTLKIQDQGQNSWPHLRSRVQSIYLFFVSRQSDHFWLIYSKFHVWPSKFKVRVIAKVKPYGLIWGLEFDRAINHAKWKKAEKLFWSYCVCGGRRHTR